MRYARSFRMPDGTIHVLGLFKIDGDLNVALNEESDPPWGGAMLHEAQMNTFFHRPGLFLSLRNKVKPDDKGRFTGHMWRSFDDLGTMSAEPCEVVAPQAGCVDFGREGGWAGLFFHRTVIELNDGSLLAAMYGNFEQDVSRPTHPQSRRETLYKLRTFVVRSTDQGRTWHYHASVAVPAPESVDDSEGFNEWTIVRLADGRLFGVMRTGHFTPLAATWSDDEGMSWTPPRTFDELGPAGVDPHLITLSDGRLALAFGQMIQPDDREQDRQQHQNRRTERCCRLAIDADGTAERWRVMDVCEYGSRSAYPSIFEIEPGVILYQSDLELWRVAIPRHQ